MASARQSRAILSSPPRRFRLEGQQEASCSYPESGGSDVVAGPDDPATGVVKSGVHVGDAGTVVVDAITGIVVTSAWTCVVPVNQVYVELVVLPPVPSVLR